MTGKKIWSAAVLSLLCIAGVALAHEGTHPTAAGLATTATVVTGWGKYAYRSVPGWCKVPEGKDIGATHGSAVIDSAGMIYFSVDAGSFGIVVYNPEGVFQRGFAGDFVGIHHMILLQEDGVDYIYGAHLKGKRIFKMKTDGSVVWTRGCPMESGKYQSEGQYNPTAVAVGPAGDVFVVDGYGQQWVHHYDRDLNYVDSFGGKGTEPGKFNTCHGIALDRRYDPPRLLICDRGNRRLQYFDLAGKFISVETTNLRLPCSVSFFGDLAAVAELEGRVVILDRENRPLSVLGSNPVTAFRGNFNVEPKDWLDAVFTAPHGITFDGNGDLFVMDWNAWGRLSRLVHIPEAQAPMVPQVDSFCGKPEVYGALIGKGANWKTSSTSAWDLPALKELFTSEMHPEFLPDFVFHTGEEVRPSVTIDLAAAHIIKAVTIRNRASLIDRAAGLSMSVSDDGENWRQVWQADKAEAIWEIDLVAAPTRGRYLKLMVDQATATYLHLQNVRIYGE